MAIPDYQTLMRPILEILSDGQNRSLSDTVRLISDRFGLTEEERNSILPSGQQTYISNRVSWARSHMRAAGLLDNPKRGYAKITERGLEVLKTGPERLTVSFLKKFPSYLEFVRPATNEIIPPEVEKLDDRTPEESMDTAYLTQRQATIDELLDKLMKCSPSKFEDVVVRLLLSMGYGGSTGRGFTTRFRSDMGVDGVIEQDKLGLEKIVVQAKRWEGSVGRPTVQGFVGSMFSYAAQKGVILSTSIFTKEAIDYASNLSGMRVVLIGGQKLAELMIDHNLGVTIKRTYELKDVSNDFFDEE